MIFRSGVFSRRPDLPLHKFTKHWVEGHGPLAGELPEMHAYFQHHIVERIYESTPFPGDHPIDGLSQLWWDDVAAMERAEVSPEYAACKIDLPKFQGTITVLVLATAAQWKAPKQVEGEASSRLMVLTQLPQDSDGKRLDPAAMEEALRVAMTPGVKKAYQYEVVDRAHPVKAGLGSGQSPVSGWTEIVFENDEAISAWLKSSQAKEFTQHHPSGPLMAIYRIMRYTIKE
ncbi:EthD family reductase [Paraburkholderia bannensis]|uniref:EthD family reductase n=1 Tax=Paraburkholderia bannensis TaxID=765414 RepID=UPI002AB71EBD|nr:EthD family reductase [Paraburkholderia bannensis]